MYLRNSSFTPLRSQVIYACYANRKVVEDKTDVTTLCWSRGTMEGVEAVQCCPSLIVLRYQYRNQHHTFKIIVFWGHTLWTKSPKQNSEQCFSPGNVFFVTWRATFFSSEWANIGHQVSQFCLAIILIDKAAMWSFENHGCLSYPFPHPWFEMAMGTNNMLIWYLMQVSSITHPCWTPGIPTPFPTIRAKPCNSGSAPGMFAKVVAFERPCGAGWLASIFLFNILIIRKNLRRTPI